MDPALRSPTGRGKGIESIVTERLGRQQEVLASETRDIYEHRTELPTYSGLTPPRRSYVQRALLLAPTHTPDDLFSQRHGCRLVAPLPSGYLIEADVNQLPRLLDVIQRPIGATDVLPVRDDEDVVLLEEGQASGGDLVFALVVFDPSRRSAPRVVEYRRDLVEKWPRKPSMCAHSASRRSASSASAPRRRHSAIRRRAWSRMVEPSRSSVGRTRRSRVPTHSAALVAYLAM